MARRNTRAVDDSGPSKGWLDSYADAVTLLLAFFIMMFAFSLVDEEKFTDFKFGVAQALGKPNPTIEGGIGLLERGNGLTANVAIPPIPSENGDGTDGEYQGSGEVTRANIEDLAAALQAKLDAAGVAESVHVSVDPRGVIIHLDDRVLFDSGEALIKLDGAAVLASLAEVLVQIDNVMSVEGHTDDVPIHTDRFPSNWELSVTRATNVLRWLVEGQGVPAARMSASGYADTHPLASNADASGRQRNRRVEIVIVVPPDDGADVNDQTFDTTDLAAAGIDPGLPTPEES